MFGFCKALDMMPLKSCFVGDSSVNVPIPNDAHDGSNEDEEERPVHAHARPAENREADVVFGTWTGHTDDDDGGQ